MAIGLVIIGGGGGRWPLLPLLPPFVDADDDAVAVVGNQPLPRPADRLPRSANGSLGAVDDCMLAAEECAAVAAVVVEVLIGVSGLLAALNVGSRLSNSVLCEADEASGAIGGPAKSPKCRLRSDAAETECCGGGNEPKRSSRPVPVGRVLPAYHQKSTNISKEIRFRLLHIFCENLFLSLSIMNPKYKINLFETAFGKENGTHLIDPAPTAWAATAPTEIRPANRSSAP